MIDKQYEPIIYLKPSLFASEIMFIFGNTDGEKHQILEESLIERDFNIRLEYIKTPFKNIIYYYGLKYRAWIGAKQVKKLIKRLRKEASDDR